MDLIKPDPGVTQSNPEPIVYRCKKCRRIIAAKSNLITHTRVTNIVNSSVSEPVPITTTSTKAIVHATQDEGVSPQQKTNEVNDHLTSAGLSKKLSTQLCMHSVNNSDRSSDCEQQPRCNEILFIEPMAWMLDICKQTQGKLNCPKCQSKLGNFTWINGCNCPCGKYVSPAFYLVPSKVELSHSVKNVEITV